jgi:hypothetical protein
LPLLLQAFEKAFFKDTDVFLKVKYIGGWKRPESHSDRVIWDCNNVIETSVINKLYRDADCFVLPTSSEGFGMPVLEAKATGLPVITTGFSAVTELGTAADTYFIDYGMKDVPTHEIDCGTWADPKLDHLIYLLRYVYEHREEAQEKGRLARKFVESRFTWEKVTRDVLPELQLK